MVQNFQDFASSSRCQNLSRYGASIIENMSEQNVPKTSEKSMFRRSITAPVQRSEIGPAAAILRAKSYHDNETPRPQRSASIVAIEELVQCGICFDKLTEPRMLPCQHTFCLSCLEAHLISTTGRTMKKKHTPPSKTEIKLMIAATETEIRCPTCQIPTKIGKGFESLRQLPRNVYIDSLLKLVEGSGNTNSRASSTCSSMVTCVKCQTVCDLPGQNCRHCKQIFCNVCWAEHLSTLKSNLSILVEHLSETETRLKHRVNDFNERCDKLTANIHRTTEEKILDIKVKEEASLEQLDKIKRHEENAANELKKRVDDVKKEIQNLKFESLPSDADKVKTFMNFHRDTSKILNDVSRWGEVRIIFDPKAFKVNHNNEFISRNGVGDDVSVTDGVSIKNPLESIETMTKHYLSKTFTPKLVWTKCPRPAGIGNPPWAPNLLYIAATDRKVVLIMDRDVSKVIGKLAAPEMLCPHGLTFCKKRAEVYVTDKWKHCIHVFSSESDYLRTICSLGSGSGELRSPEGIAINQQGELIVCDAGNDRVVILDSVDGRLLSTIGMVDKRTELQAPTSVAVHEEKIIIADNGNHAVKVFSASGKKLLEFGSMGSNKGQFRTPEVVTCDPMGFILVGDAGNARIQIFQPDGTLVRILGGYGEAPGRFAWVSGLAVTPQLEIVTTDYKNRRLQIF